MGRLSVLVVFSVVSCILSIDAAPPVEPPAGGKDSPSIIESFMNIVNGKFSLKDLLGMGPLLRNGFEEIENMINFSPVFQKMVQEAAKNNPKVKVFNTILQGKTPNLVDIFRMVTSNSESIQESFEKVEKSYPKWLQMEAIMKPNRYNNHANLKKIVEIIAGRKIDENVVKLKSDKYTVSELSDLVYQNVLQLAYFFGDNYVSGKKAMRMLSKEPIDYRGILRLLTKADLSNLPTTMIPGANKNPSTNPDSVHLLNNVKTKYPQILAENDDKKASAAVFDALSSLLKITDEVFTEAENLANNQANSEKQT